ncbi:18643_t:CDS:2, partial [Racocetra fulgida]
LTDQVLFWLGELQSAIIYSSIIFKKQIIEACSKLCNQELTALLHSLKLVQEARLLLSSPSKPEVMFDRKDLIAGQKELQSIINL